MNHRLESWVYATAAARTGASGFVSGDIGRIAYQTDNGTYWRLTAITPTWQSVPPPVTPPAYANLQQTPLANPAGTGGLTAVYMGLAVGSAPAAAKITPTATGKLFVTLCGSVYHVTADKNVFVAMYYGTGAAPANAAPSPGTGINFGGVTNRGGPGVTAPANTRTPFSLTGVITGLALGVPVWLDASVLTAGTAGGAIESVSFAAVELP